MSKKREKGKREREGKRRIQRGIFWNVAGLNNKDKNFWRKLEE